MFQTVPRRISYLLTLLLILSLTFMPLTSGMEIIEVSAAQATGTTYYISDSAGDDQNDGLSESSPFKTIERLTEVKLVAGDTVRFKSGDIWYGAFELDLSGGEKDNVITFTSYGEGTKPSIRLYSGSVTPGLSGICLKIYNANGFVMDGLDVGYANQGIKLIYDEEHYNSEYVRFTNCHFHDIWGVIQFDYNPDIYFSSAITVDALTDDWYPKVGENGEGWPLCGLYIDNCTAYDAGSMVCGPTGVYGFYMTDCVIEECGYYGATVFGNEGGYIDRCIFRNNGSRDFPCGSATLMIACENFTVRNSIIYGQQRQGTDPDGCGIDFEADCKNVLIENCLLQECSGAGIFYFTSGKGADGTNYDTHIRNCYFVNNNVNIGNVGGFEVFVSGYGASNCELTGNKWIVTDFKRSETVDFSYIDRTCEMVLEDNVYLDAIPENLEHMILNPESGSNGQGSSVPNNFTTILWCAIAAFAAIALSLCLWLILKVRKK